ncbi:hypothetical protein BaRGS_00015552 [Batillaria attramentaria]|uniref:Uncharacterized protein n=1 Tax=Batillaria attramentaria TaxID=370345 RepID=A0ABD0L1P1_9CAEN
MDRRWTPTDPHHAVYYEPLLTALILRLAVADVPHIAPSNEAEVISFIWIGNKSEDDKNIRCDQHDMRLRDKVR